MPTNTDFKAFATGSNALVLTPSSLATQPWLIGGFNGGVADAASLNTLWRQGNFVAASISQWMANTLNQNIFDDGNINSFITLFGAALANAAGAGVTSFNTRTGAVVLLSNDVTSALGFTPVISFAGPGGTPRTGPVNMIAADVNQALGYTPVNKGGDTMTGFLAGPEPSVAANYATKNYVDRATSNIKTGSITNIGNEYDLPLPFGGLMKIGLYWPGWDFTNRKFINGVGFNSGSSYRISFANQFPTTCAGAYMLAVGTTGFSTGTPPPNPGEGPFYLALSFTSFPDASGFNFWNVSPVGVTTFAQTIPGPGPGPTFPGFANCGIYWVAVGF